jgi:hypothetical protein
VRTTANGRTVDEWKNRVSNPDNHWFDCLVGCAVGASMQGAELSTLQTQKIRRAQKYFYQNCNEIKYK